MQKAVALCLLGALGALGCSPDPKVLRLEIVTGHETSAMTQDPAVSRVTVIGTTPEGEEIKAEAAPGGDLDFGEVDGDLAYTFEVTGFDGPGNEVLRGRSLGGLVLNGIEGETLPLFAQRKGEWARPPGELSRSHVSGPATAIGERFLFVTGGEAANDVLESEEYDLFAWAGAKGPTFPFPAETLVSFVDRLLALGGNQAQWLSDSGFEIATDVEDVSFNELSGGSAIFAPDGRTFIVGATRLNAKSDAVLQIAEDETVTVLRLNFARKGAAAAWLPEVGLVISGGAETGKGVEVLAEQGTSFAARDFPEDPTLGAAAIATSLGTLMLVGGEINGIASKTRLLDPRCASACSAEIVEEASPAEAVTRLSGFAIEKGRALVVGEESDPTGGTRAYLIDYLTPSLKELPFKEPRKGATCTPAPNGTLAVVGGVHEDGSPALTVEMFFPE